MKSLKKWIGATVIATTLVSVSSVQAAPRYVGGNGYQQSRAAPSLAPAIALGAIALAAIIAIAVQKSEHGHSH